MNELNLTEEECLECANAVTHPLYRTMQLWHVALSLTSVGLLLHVLTVVKKRLSFHYNIKILLVSILCACMFHSIWITTFTCHHLIVSFTYRNECDVILKPNIHQFFNVPLGSVVLWIEFTTIVMFVERCVATLFYRCYERKGKRLGNIFLATSMAIPACLTFYIFYGLPKTVPQISALNTPPQAAPTVTFLMLSLSSLNVGAALMSWILYYINKKKTEIGNESLSARYQKAENAVSSKFLAFVIFGTLVLIAAYGGATAYLKIKFSPEEQVCGVFYKSYIMIAYTIPLYTVIFPGMVLFGIKQMEKRRHNKVENLIQVRSVGEDGWNNYADQLRNQWG